MRHPYAQTPAQLFRQLDPRGFLPWEKQDVKRACNLAIDLYSGLSRACGKPFLCHAIGTASILADHGAPGRLVCAGLLHAAYSHGRFGDGSVGETSAKHARLAESGGEGVANLVQRYTRFDWEKPARADFETLERMPLDDAAICLLRIANDLEERLDGALHYCGKPPGGLVHWHDAWQRLSERVGAGRLYQEYALSLACGAEVPKELRNAAPYSFAVRERDRSRVPFHANPLRPKKRRGPLRRWLRRLRKGR